MLSSPVIFVGAITLAPKLISLSHFRGHFLTHQRRRSLVTISKDARLSRAKVMLTKAFIQHDLEISCFWPIELLKLLSNDVWF